MLRLGKYANSTDQVYMAYDLLSDEAEETTYLCLVKKKYTRPMPFLARK